MTSRLRSYLLLHPLPSEQDRIHERHPQDFDDNRGRYGNHGYRSQACGPEDRHAGGYRYPLVLVRSHENVCDPLGPVYARLLLDNFHAASETAGIYTPASEQDKVYVAIEFLNNSGTDFYGNGNLIRNGGFFYLIGCLDPSGTNGGSITWPTDHPVPPYNADGSSQEVKRVFIQDFLTTATFTLGENSLHYAYLTVPDLRSSSMSLGLSVDLNWETGLNFDDVILGGN